MRVELQQRFNHGGNGGEAKRLSRLAIRQQTRLVSSLAGRDSRVEQYSFMWLRHRANDDNGHRLLDARPWGTAARKNRQLTDSGLERGRTGRLRCNEAAETTWRRICRVETYGDGFRPVLEAN